MFFLEVTAVLSRSCHFTDEDTEVQRIHKTRKVVELESDATLALFPPDHGSFLRRDGGGWG